jgi:hypothetical protein
MPDLKDSSVMLVDMYAHINDLACHLCTHAHTYTYTGREPGMPHTQTHKHTHTHKTHRAKTWHATYIKKKKHTGRGPGVPHIFCGCCHR